MRIFIFCCVFVFQLAQNIAAQSVLRANQLYDELFVHANELTDNVENVHKYYEYALLCSENEGAWDALKEPEVCFYGLEMSIRLRYQKGIDDFLGVLKQCYYQNEIFPEIENVTYPESVSRKTLRLLQQRRKVLHGGTVDWYERAYLIYMNQHMFREAGIVSFWNALAFYDLENFSQAHHLFAQAKRCFRVVNDDRYLMKTSLFEGCTYYFEKQYSNAINELNTAASLCVKNKDTIAYPSVLNNRGETYLAMNEPVLALNDFSEALRFLVLLQDTNRAISLRIKLAHAHYLLERYQICIETLQQAIESANRSANKHHKVNALYLLACSQSKAGNAADANISFQQFILLRDSLFTAEVDSLANEREYFWINKLGRQITNQAFIDHERNKYFVELRKSKLIVFGVVILALLLAVVGIVLYRSGKNKKRANDYLSQLDKTRNLFFSIIAHDLRGPLIATDYLLKPAISLAEQKGETELFSSLKEIETQNIRRKLLLDNLLSWAALQRGSMKCNLQPVSIKPLVEKVVSFCHFAAKQTDASVIIDQMPDVTLSADPDMMQLILRNLIDNSLKHGGRGVEIQINGVSEGPNLRITFADNGKGMSKEAVDAFNSKSTPDDTGSSRLGLSLIRYFVAEQNGQIVLQSNKDGFSISCTIPLYVNN